MAAHVSFLLQCQCFISCVRLFPVITDMLLLGSPNTREAQLGSFPPGPARFLAPLAAWKRLAPSPGASPALAKPTLVRLSAIGLPDSSLVEVTRSPRLLTFTPHPRPLLSLPGQQHLTPSPPLRLRQLPRLTVVLPRPSFGFVSYLLRCCL